MKLLYFLDFKHFKETGKSVTGLRYTALKMGSVPVPLYEEISAETLPQDISESIKIIQRDRLQQIASRKEFNGKYFTKREKRLLEQLAFIFEDVKSEDMIESTHLLNSPWDKTKKEKGLNQQIDYFLALDNSPESLEHHDAANRVQERHEMYRAFGVKK